MNVTRRLFLTSVAVGSIYPAAAFSKTSLADRPIKVVVPFVAGGAGDTIARKIVEQLSKTSPFTVVVLNRGGAGGTIGASVVSEAKNDGHSILFTTSALASAPSVFASLPFDPVKDFTPIIGVGTTPLIMLISPKSSASTLDETISELRQSATPVTYASPGVGTPIHMVSEFINKSLGLDAIHIPYKSISRAAPDLASGRISMILDGPASGLNLVKNGLAKAVMVTGSTRLSVAPDLPTAIDLGHPEFDMPIWYGIFGPADMPTDVTRQLSNALSKALSEKKLKSWLEIQGIVVEGLGSGEFATVYNKEVIKWAKFAKLADVKPR